jgi:hypothetical protein
MIFLPGFISALLTLLYRIDETVVPAKAGTHLSGTRNSEEWIPAFAGTAVKRGRRGCPS